MQVSLRRGAMKDNEAWNTAQEQGYEDVRNCPAVSLAIQREHWSFVNPIINSQKRITFTKIQGSCEQAKIMQMLVAVMELTSTIHAIKIRRSLSRTCFHSKVAEERLITPDWMTKSA